MIYYRKRAIELHLSNQRPDVLFSFVSTSQPSPPTSTRNHHSYTKSTSPSIVHIIASLQIGEISLTKRLGSSVKSLIARKTNSGDRETADGHANMGVDGENLELAYRGTNANKEVLDDCTIQENKSNERLEKAAASIDNISRVLFPLSFVVYNIYYCICYYTD